jgi:hypothetical protein
MKSDRRSFLLQLSKLELFGTRIDFMLAPLAILTVIDMSLSKRSICTNVLR